MSRGPKQAFFQRHTDRQRALEKRSTSLVIREMQIKTIMRLVIREMQIKTIMRYHLTIVSMTKITKMRNSTC